MSTAWAPGSVYSRCNLHKDSTQHLTFSLNTPSAGSGPHSLYKWSHYQFLTFFFFYSQTLKETSLHCFSLLSSRPRQFWKKMKDRITKRHIAISILPSQSSMGTGLFNILQGPWQLLLQWLDMQFPSLFLWVFVPFSLTTKRNKDPNYTHNHYYLKKFPVIKF